MTGNNSLGPKLSPDHSCGEVFDNYVIDCSSHAATYKEFTVLIANTGSTAIELEYSIFGWTGEFEEATERFELTSGTAESRFNGTILASQYILDWEDSLEAEVSYTMEKENMTYEEAIEHLESQGINSTHSSWGNDPRILEVRTWEEQWDDYEQYSWEIVLVSGNGTWDVLWMDSETKHASGQNNLISEDENWSSALNQRGMSSSGSKGPLDKPEQSCTGEPNQDGMWFNQYGLPNDCTRDLEERHSDFYHLYIISRSSGGDTGAAEFETVDFVIEWTIFGWK